MLVCLYIILSQLCRLVEHHIIFVRTWYTCLEDPTKDNMLVYISGVRKVRNVGDCML